MIKIQRLPAPIELTDEVVRIKTAFFKADPKKNHVWKESYIEEQLMRMSHEKCCYCECKLGEESKYMEVEHFHDKDDYPDEVVVWENLLPCCKTCNGNKSNHDTIADPIVNPSVDDPKDYLGFHDFRYKGMDPGLIGKETIEALHLNDFEKKCLPRYRVCSELLQKVEDLLDDVVNIQPSSTTREKNKMKRKVSELLEACQEDKEYTAIKATTMKNSPDYNSLINEMKSRGLWTPVLDELHASMSSFALDKV